MARLICFFSVGTSPSEVTYTWSGQAHTSKFAIEAAFQLGIINRDQDRVAFFPILTSQTKPLGQEIQNALEQGGHFRPDEDTWIEDALMTSGDGTAEEVINHILGHVAPGDRVFVEPTAGLRHIQMALLASAIFLGAIHHGIKLERLVYSDYTGPIRDLGVITDLFAWARDAQAFGDHLDAGPLLDRLKKAQFIHLNRAQFDNTVNAFLAGTAPHVLANLRRFPALQGALAEAGSRVPVLAMTLVEDRLGRLIAASRRTTPNKLDLAWLDAELLFAKALYESGRGVDAVVALREWIVNVVLFAEGYDQADWNRYVGRQPAEVWLNRRRPKSGSPKLPTPSVLDDLLLLWNKVADLRNTVVHGYRGGESQNPPVKSIPEHIDDANRWWEQFKESGARVTFEPGSEVRHVRGEPGRVFLNLSNHRDWPDAQVSAAFKLGATEIRHHPFPEVDPMADDQTLDTLARETLGTLDLGDVGWAMVQGEPVMATRLVQLLQQRGVTCYVATTPRDSVMQDGVKVSAFRFGQFRSWPMLGAAQ